MSKSDNCSRDQIAEYLQRHTLAPIVRAVDAVASEREEVQAEIDAFRSFLDRVSELEPTQSTTGSPAPRSLSHAGRADTSRRLRTAYEETVLSVEHYDRVYDEPLAEHVAAELSPQLTPLFESNRVAFTEVYRRTLHEAVREAVGSREQLISVLGDEATSLETARDRLQDVLDRAGTSGPQAAPAGDERDRLDEIARQRQAELKSRPRLAQLNGHEFCEYAYESEAWTYPVLTAVARLRESIAE
jgi:hypothetical protein